MKTYRYRNQGKAAKRLCNRFLPSIFLSTNNNAQQNSAVAIVWRTTLNEYKKYPPHKKETVSRTFEHGILYITIYIKPMNIKLVTINID